MKRILFLFIVCLLLISCHTEGTKKVDNISGIYGEVLTKEIIYEGHSYIEFKDQGIYGQGWLHNPECLKKDIDSLINK